MNNVSYYYNGASDGYYVTLDGEEVHFTKETYERDMFIAELKARIKIIERNAKDSES